MKHTMNARRVAAGLLASMLAWPAAAASIATYSLDQPGADSLTFIIDSIAASGAAGPFSRFRPSLGAVSSMGTDVLPNTNLVALGNIMWFTTRGSPYRIGKANLSVTSGSPVYYTPSGI